MSGNTKKLGGGIPYWHLCDGEGRLIVIGAPGVQAEETANDSDKTLTVPADTWWTIKSIWIELTTDATVADRRIQVDIRDGDSDVVFSMRVGETQDQSQTRYYSLAPGLADLTAFRDGYLTTPFPELTIPEDWSVRIWEKNVVAVGADDMIIQIIVQARTVLESVES